MNEDTKDLAERLLAGDLREQDFLREVAKLSLAATESANVDIDRQRRAGYPEVVYGEGKTNVALRDIIQKLQSANQDVLVTRTSPDQATFLLSEFGDLIHNPVARTIRSSPQSSSTRAPSQDTKASDTAATTSQPCDTPSQPCVAVVTAGTSDLPVAEEVAETLLWMHVDVVRVTDVGVAGPHRLPAHLDKFESAQCVVVVAGMEGALPSVVAGYLSVPIIGVPTSVGYGANLGGVAALLSMLNSCAANVAVVNIDAGFKAGYLAGMIACKCRGASAEAQGR